MVVVKVLLLLVAAAHDAVRGASAGAIVDAHEARKAENMREVAAPATQLDRSIESTTSEMERVNGMMAKMQHVAAQADTQLAKDAPPAPVLAKPPVDMSKYGAAMKLVHDVEELQRMTSEGDPAMAWAKQRLHLSLAEGAEPVEAQAPVDKGWSLLAFKAKALKTWEVGKAKALETLEPGSVRATAAWKGLTKPGSAPKGEVEAPSYAMVAFALTAGCVAAAALYTRSDAQQPVVAAVGFMACSSSLLLLNKLAITFTQAPVLVTAAQLVFTLAAAAGAHAAGVIELDPLRWADLKRFLPIGLTFLVVVVMNAEIMAAANLETMLVARATPVLLICVLEAALLGQPWPSASSALCLLGVVAATLAYGAFESSTFHVQLTVLIAGWYLAFCFDQIYIKHVITELKLKTVTNVFYTNAVAAAAVMPFAVREARQLPSLHFSAAVLVLIGASCLLGAAMSYFSFAARAAFSATTFTLLGNVCKVGSLLGNHALWGRHAGPAGTGMLFLALIAAYGYEESKRTGPGLKQRLEEQFRRLQEVVALRKGG